MGTNHEKRETDVLDETQHFSSPSKMLQAMTTQLPFMEPQNPFLAKEEIPAYPAPTTSTDFRYSHRQLKKPDINLTVQESPEGTLYGLSKASPISGLVLSGGGARGIAYAGMVQALYEAGTINQITHICGASAGAMSASLIALGMDADDFVSVVRDMNVSNLINDKTFGRSDGDRFTNILELIYYVQIKKLISESNRLPSNVPPSLQRKLSTYTNLLMNAELKENSMLKNIKNIQDVLELTQDPKSLAALDNAFKTLRANKYKSDASPYQDSFSFKDLADLRTFLPDNQKHRMKHLIIPVTNLTTQRSETYSEDHNAHESLALKVQTSGSHPLLFQSRLDPHSGHYHSDGGIYDNMPDSLLLEFMKPSQILCVGVLDAETMPKELEEIHNLGPKRIPSFRTYVESRITGLQDYGIAVKNLRERQSEYKYHDQLLLLNSGPIKATSTQLNYADKEQVIAQAKAATTEYILKTRGPEIILQHNHPLSVMAQLPEDKLREIATGNEYSNIEKQSAQLALIIMRLQFDCSIDLLICQNLLDKKENKKCEDWFNNYFRKRLSHIDAILKEEGLVNVPGGGENPTLKLCKIQINYMTYGALEKFEKLFGTKSLAEEETENNAVGLSPRR